LKRGLFIAIAVVVAVPVGAVGAANWYLSGDAVRARAVEAVRRATGRELVIAGPVRLGWGWAPTIEASDVSLSNPPGFSRPAMAHADGIKAQIGLWDLFSRRIVVERLVVAAPDLRLERDAQGRPNWLFSPPVAPVAAPAGPSSSGGGRFQLVLGRVDVTAALLGWGGAAVAVPRLSYDPATAGVSGAFDVHGQAFMLSGTAGPFAGSSWPVDLRLAGAGAAAGVAGTSEAARLSVEAADVTGLAALAGYSLPGARDARLTGNLSPAGMTDLELRATVAVGTLPVVVSGRAASWAQWSGGTLHAEADGAVLDAQGAGAGAWAVRLSAADLGALGARAGLALPSLRDLKGTATVRAALPMVSLTGLVLTSVQGDVAGDLTLKTGPRASVRGVLTSRSIDVGALIPPRPAAATPPSGAAPQAPAPAAPPRAIPDTELPFTALRRADADLQLTIADALWRGHHYRSVAAHLVLQDGKLAVDPASMVVGEQTITARLGADATAVPPAASVMVSAPGLPAGPALTLIDGPEDATGVLDVRADLRGRGATLRAQAAALEGHVGVALVDGQVSNAWLQAWLGASLRAANLPVEAGGTSAVRCFALRAEAAAGHVQLRALALDTSKLKLDGGGEINLADETLDLRLRPLLRLGTSLSVPVRVRGTLLAPKVTLDPGAISPGRVGITIGGAALADTCGPALALARDGQAGKLPEAAAAAEQRPLKPADLLRSLLR